MRAGLFELLDIDVGYADIADLALVLEILQRPDRLLVGHLAVGGVQLIEVNSIDPEPAQRALAGPLQMLGVSVAWPFAWPGALHAALRRNRDPLVGMQRLGDQLLAHLGAVGVGGVDQVYAELGQPPQQPPVPRPGRPVGPRCHRR